ncbi:MAG: radical SAM protein [Clostridiales bacterium]|nr:radical SAM protein [Clostridiales bacterium]
MSLCNVCPKNCNSNRNDNVGFCGASKNIKVAKAYLHEWEEPFISGTKGSGTVFFSHCNLKCVFCQNYKISAEGFGKNLSQDELYGVFKNLEQQGAHNINLVTPSHYVPYILPVLQKFKQNSNLPIVYNCGGYEKVETLKMLDGLVDVYLPDMKYVDSRISQKYSHTSDYFDVNTQAVLEMKRQQPQDLFDGDLLTKGVVVRHLVMPNLVDQSKKILDWICNNLGKNTLVSLMAQYQPFYRANEFGEINRKITEREYSRVLDYADQLEMENILCQEMTSSNEKYVPSFDLQGV